MIKIDRIAPPEDLTPEIVAKKTADFKKDHTNIVWRDNYIVNHLMKMSLCKCSYCECKIGEESKYMEVDHFHHKDKYEDEVVKWENLLPSCKVCNVHKGDHDTYVYPIIDPTKDDPREHLYFYLFQLKGKTELGTMTETVLNLNDSSKHCLPRFQIYMQLIQTLNGLLDSVSSLTPQSPVSNKTRVRNRIKDFLQLCQSSESYTAIKATTIANDNNYKAIISKLQLLGLWTEPLVSLDRNMRKYVLDIEPPVI